MIWAVIACRGTQSVVAQPAKWLENFGILTVKSLSLQG